MTQANRWRMAEKSFTRRREKGDEGELLGNQRKEQGTVEAMPVTPKKKEKVGKGKARPRGRDETYPIFGYWTKTAKSGSRLRVFGGEGRGGGHGAKGPQRRVQGLKRKKKPPQAPGDRRGGDQMGGGKKRQEHQGPSIRSINKGGLKKNPEWGEKKTHFRTSCTLEKNGQKVVSKSKGTWGGGVQEAKKN